MTRGTFYIITNDKLYSSIEWNGDMYPEGHGVTAKKMLEAVTNVDEFKAMVVKFDKQENFNYQEEVEEYRSLVYEHPISILDKYADFNYNYFDLQEDFCWFSDWLFIKNLSTKAWTFTYATERGTPDEQETVTLEPGKTLIANYGHEVSEEDMAVLEERTKESTDESISYGDYQGEIAEEIATGVTSSTTHDGKVHWSIDYQVVEEE